jgi:hypothetical protein
MAKIIPLRAREHQDLQNLLGWYAAGALEPDDRARVERHLGGCARCRQRLGEESQLQSRLEEVSFEVDNDWARLRARIEGERPSPALRPPLASPRGARALAARSTWGWLLAAQFLLFLTVGVAVFTWSQPRYHVLSAPSLLPGGNVIVMFRPDTPEKDFREALRSGGARLVDGPTDTGVYVLRVAPKTRPAALAALRQRRSVAMAEPIDTRGPP